MERFTLNSLFEQYEAMVGPCLAGQGFTVGKDLFQKERLGEIMLVASRRCFISFALVLEGCH